MCVALVLGMLAATTASAGEMISLQKVRFCTWDGWVDANPTGKAACEWVIGEATGQPYGDSGVNNYADLSKYTKLVIKYTDGTPRVLLNRDMNDGQCSATESESHLIDNTNSGCMTWAAKYFTTEDGVLTVNLKQLVTDKGYAHLHAIKANGWGSTVTVTSMEVEKAPAIGWTDIIENGDLEWDDNSSFFTKVDRGEPTPSEITDGVGVDGSRGIMVAATAKVDQAWDNQFWIYANEPLPAGTKYKLSFDYRADVAAKATTQAHAEPSDYIHYVGIGDVEFIPDWQTFSVEGEISADQSKDDKQFHSWAFNLSELADANNYYFDNIKFQVLKFGTQAEFYNDVILVDFGFDTNLADLVKAAGTPRIFYPNECATVKVNGETVELYSIEGLADGRFFIFLNDGVEENANVTISFTNPTDEALQLKYTSGINTGKVISDFQDVAASYNNDIDENEAYPWDFVKPRIAKADPENGSFNLPNSIKEFKVIFDKEVQVAELQATLNGVALTVNANDAVDGLATDFTLTREGADLADGEYILALNNVQPKDTGVGDFGNYEIVLNIGKVADDPDDVEELVMTDDFAASGASWIVNADAGGMQDANTTGGCRIQHGQSSAFTADVLYLCSRTTPAEQGGVALYGTKEDAKLFLKAKNYHLTFGAAQWDRDDARSLLVQVLPDGAVSYENGAVLDESQILVEERKPIEPKKDSGKATWFDVVIPVTAEGNYIIRLVPGTLSGGNGGWADGCAIGNVKVEYLPNKVGAEWVRLLKTALESAKKVLANYSDERYAGEAQTALSNAISNYEAAMENFTAPSAYQNAADDLDALGTALDNHGKLCNDYDSNIKTALDVVRQVAAEYDNGVPNEKHKFASTDMYGELCTIVAKYNGSSEWRNVSEDPEVEDIQLIYEYDKLTDDAALTAAIEELKDIAKTTNALFTVGTSATGDSGVKVLFERIRRGIEVLKKVGVAEDDALLVYANNAITDDDDIAEALKNRIKIEVYGKIKDNALSFEKVDDSDPENPITTAISYDMSVFAKNPNIYALQVKDGFTADNVPGWEVTAGTGEISTMWVPNTPRNIPGVAEDVTFTRWHSATRMQQTISDLPAGVYSVVLDAAEWSDEFTYKDDDTDEQKAEKDAKKANGFAFVKTSETVEPEEGAEESREANFAATTTLKPGGNGHGDNVLDGIVVVDGILTVGANFGPDAQYMFDQIKAINLTAAASGINYSDLYNEAVTSIGETVSTDNKVRAIELYDLNGRRVTKATKGMVIMKKVMSDGTIRTQKVVK